MAAKGKVNLCRQGFHLLVKIDLVLQEVSVDGAVSEPQLNSVGCGVKGKKQSNAAFPVNEETHCKGAVCSWQGSNNLRSCSSLKRGGFSLGQHGDRKNINTLKGMRWTTSVQLGRQE